MTREELIKKAKGAKLHALDNLIYAAFLRNAELANGEGIESQIDNLIDLGWSIQRIDAEVESILERERVENEMEAAWCAEMQAEADEMARQCEEDDALFTGELK
jgi:hypothetical protein